MLVFQFIRQVFLFVEFPRIVGEVSIANEAVRYLYSLSAWFFRIKR